MVIAWVVVLAIVLPVFALAIQDTLDLIVDVTYALEMETVMVKALVSAGNNGL